MEVTIFFKNGATAYFKEVDDFMVNIGNIKITYFEVSSQERKQAAFYKDSIAGIAMTQEVE